jgi:hypothetical protein
MQKSNQAKHVIHAYLKYTPASGYMECSLCKNRTHSICIKCRSCYTCHCELLSEQKQQKKEWQRKVIDVYSQSATIVDAIINFQYMATIPINANADTPLIMLQEYH